MSSENVDKKPTIPTKSSMEILSELFSTFHAEPPLIIKKEKSEESTRKHKKSKKKHKHKDKKHKKKDKKKKRSGSSSSNESEVDLAQILIKQEKDASEKKIKIEGTDIVWDKNSTTPTRVKAEAGEDGEITDSASSSDRDVKTRKRRKKHKSRSKKRSRSSSSKEESTSKKLKLEDLRHKLKHERSGNDNGKDRRSSRSKDDFYRRSSDERRDRARDRSNYRSRSRERFKDSYERNVDDYKKHRSRDNSFYDDGFYKSRDRTEEKDEKWGLRDRYRDRRYRSNSRECESSKFDKKKLLEIARKNAITMMKSGSLPGALTLGPQAQEKVIAAIKSGGKTVEELTDFCKTLSKKEELGELSSLSEKEDSDSETDRPFHHPFQIKDRPTSITMNIKNSVPLPLKSSMERTSELRMQFPVSSGQQHRKGEEWLPVSPRPEKKVEEKTKVNVKPVPIINIPLPLEQPPLPPELPVVAIPEPPVPVAVVPPIVPPVAPTFTTTESAVDIGSIVSQRLTAMRKLQENPHDVQALTQMYKSNKEMQFWAVSKQQPGQFTGSTGAQILSQAQLSSGYQAWAKKAVIIVSRCTGRNPGDPQKPLMAPVSGGMGMHLLQKMGWKPGEGLGKEKTGALEPLLLEVKLDKKGLVANEEQKGKVRKQKAGPPNVKNLQGKHPVSLLGEYASKRKLGAPQYVLEFECGPDHKKNFLFKVVLNGCEYKPNVASNNKKEAKAAAATICLQAIGLLPS